MEPLEEKILHIDEDDTTQDIVKDIFRKIDVKVDSAGTFNEAWEYLQNKGYEKYTGLVISAELYGEEGRNGIDLAREALKLGFDSDKYPLIMVAPKNNSNTAGF